MIAEIIILVFALFFFVFSAFLFNGKGKWLIAGYNTASKEERKKFDKKNYAGRSPLFVLFARLCFE